MVSRCTPSRKTAAPGSGRPPREESTTVPSRIASSAENTTAPEPVLMVTTSPPTSRNPWTLGSAGRPLSRYTTLAICAMRIHQCLTIQAPEGMRMNSTRPRRGGPLLLEHPPSLGAKVPLEALHGVLERALAGRPVHGRQRFAGFFPELGHRRALFSPRAALRASLHHYPRGAGPGPLPLPARAGPPPCLVLPACRSAGVPPPLPAGGGPEPLPPAGGSRWSRPLPGSAAGTRRHEIRSAWVAGGRGPGRGALTRRAPPGR